MSKLKRLRDFVQAFTRLVDQAGDDEGRVLSEGRPLLSALIRHDDWLPGAFAESDPAGYRQYLLYCDPRERFTVVSFVWGPGQGSPIHDHTVWGMIGVLRGAETCEEYARGAEGGPLRPAGSHRLSPGEIDVVSPRLGDIHRVSNALVDRASVSIHVYGANIGNVRRSLYDPDSGARTAFVSGYSSVVLPNLWDHPKESPG